MKNILRIFLGKDPLGCCPLRRKINFKCCSLVQVLSLFICKFASYTQSLWHPWKSDWGSQTLYEVGSHTVK